MEILHTVKETRELVRAWRINGERIGLVPTMGFLHEGHFSLMRRAKRENDRVVTSIFVNPIQFGPKEDFASYPRDMEADSAACRHEAVDLIFAPTVEEMYPVGFCSYIDMDKITAGLCGKSRPGHFRGVCTVVAKLFNIVTPDKAYFGQKDAQQVAVIQRMTRDLSMGLEIVSCPTVRESDGLAKSSRNAYLSAEERKAALAVSRAVFKGEKLVKEKGERDAGRLIAAMRETLAAEPLAKVDYIEVVGAESMEKVDRIDGSTLVALAVFIGKTRLLDNFVCHTA
ncbi:MAG: pantoate--beta-alanine ligase [Deltaproteobacteria bacterium]|jgi:pantoate--beta-alanine ligase|nr:pantoate--beta-alanine ligase [Deltaproteobacteria bacterium]